MGASLANAIPGTGIELAYSAAGNREVDFVLHRGDVRVAIEVKSGRRREGLPGLDAFVRAFPGSRRLLVGEHGIPIAEFLRSPPGRWLD